jgi:outer membrane protein assembly factor BamB
MEGEEAWTANSGTKAHGWGSWSSPVFCDGLLILNAAIECGEIGSFETSSGGVRWHTPGLGTCWSTPVLVETTTGSRELVLNTEGRIVAFNPESGEELWSCRGFSGNVASSVVAHQGIVYATGGKNGVTVAIQAGGRGDVTESHVLWRANYGAGSTSPLYHDGHVYVINDRGTAYCLSAVDGQLVTEKPISTGDVFASPVVADGKIYMVTRERGTFVLSASPDMTTLAENHFESDGSAFNASPAVCDGQLFLRSDRFLYCLGLQPAAPMSEANAQSPSAPASPRS